MSWITELQLFIYTKLLPLAEPDDERRVKLVDQSSMAIWQAAFTDKSYDPNYGFNYEVLEKIGDAAIKLVFNRYLLVRFPDIDQLELSELSAFYLSKTELADIGNKLGVGHYARTNLDKNTHLIEDIVESIFGALMIIGDQAFQVGVGYILCYNLAVNIWNNRPISLDVSAGMPKTQIKQVFEKLRWGPVSESWEEPIFKVMSTPEARQQMEKVGIKLPEVLGVGQGNTKVIASNAAYQVALKTLNELGITQQYANEQRDKLEHEIPTIKSLLPLLQNKLAAQGYASYMFSIPRTTADRIYVQLLGVKPNGYKQVLSTVMITGTSIKRANLTDGKIQAIKDYIDNDVHKDS